MPLIKPQPIFLQDYAPPRYLIEKVNLDFILEEAWTEVRSELFIKANPESHSLKNDIRLDGENLELISVALNGKILSKDQYTKDDHSLTIFNVPATFSLQIENRIKPQDNTALSGLYKSNGNFCTQCEPHGFRRITYFLDRPDVLAFFRTTITAREENYPVLLSNGNLIASKKLPDGKHQTVWEDPFKKPCYLFALVAGQLSVVEDCFVTASGRKVILRLYVEQENQDQCAHAMQALKKAMRWDEERFGREYDLNIYMIVAVGDFNMGAMENKGLNIFNTQYILAKPDTATDVDFVNIEAVIAHEYCHNWSGNRVTCRDWFQLSLKEGLTIFRDQLFTADTTSETVARINDVNDLRNNQFPEDAGPLAHAVQPESYVEINNFYTTTIYNKGAEVIRMQQTILGDALFRKGLDYYFAEYDGKAVTIEEFVSSMETVSAIDLSQFRLWYKQAGTPELTIQDSYDPHTLQYTLTIKQACPITPGQVDKKPFHIPIKMGLLHPGGKEVYQNLLHLKEKEQTFYFENITTKPIPSLLRGFSAPVKIQFPYTDEALLFLLQYDTDLFNRWDAGQQYGVRLILRLIKDLHHGQPLILPQAYTKVFAHLIKTMPDDLLLLTELIILPSEKYLTEQMSIIDIDGIHFVREFLLNALAQQFKLNFIELYEENHTPHYVFDIKAIGRRQIKNLSLMYLSLLNDNALTQKYIVSQFYKAYQSNMTDAIGALRCLVNMNYADSQNMLDEFYLYWKDNPLVVDKWFALQATSKLRGTLDKVQQLMHHPAFDIKNPNKVYSLIGAFAHRNLIGFHAPDGKGYQFLAECVKALDPLNPQVAARMLKPLSEWRRYDSNRQELMQVELTSILKNKYISKDVYEIASKSLGA